MRRVLLQLRSRQFMLQHKSSRDVYQASVSENIYKNSKPHLTKSASVLRTSSERLSSCTLRPMSLCPLHAKTRHALQSVGPGSASRSACPSPRASADSHWNVWNSVGQQRRLLVVAIGHSNRAGWTGIPSICVNGDDVWCGRAGLDSDVCLAAGARV